MEGLPGPALQAVLAAAGPDAAGALRLAGRAAAAAAADALPGLSFTVTPATTRADVDAWLRATRRLAHAPRLTVRVAGAAPAAALDALLARVAARGAPRVLVLRAAGPHGAGASVPAACLGRVGRGTAALRLSGVALSADGAAPAAALLEPLAAAASSLRHLDLGAAWACGAPLQDASAALAALRALPQLRSLRAALPAPSLAAPPAALAGLVASAGPVRAQLRDAAAGALAAVLPLRGLRTLALTGLPDVWADGNRAAAADEEEPALPATFAALGDACAAAMPGLRRLRVGLAGGWAMRWGGRMEAAPAGDDGAFGSEEEEKEEEEEGDCDGGCANGGRLALREIEAVAAFAPRRGAAAPAAAAAPADLRARLLAALAPYCGAGAGAAAAVTALSLSMPLGDVPGLEAALSALPALRSARLAVMATPSAGAAPLDALAAAAAAGAPGLRELALLPGTGPAALSPSTLVPLLGAAPRLRALRLVGALAPAAGASAADAWAALAAAPALARLAVHNVAASRLELPAAALPACLEEVDLRGIRLTAPGATASAAAPGRAGPPAARPALRRVSLVGCDVDDVAAVGLSGPAVRSAVVANTRLRGAGWGGAARAWPALASLRASADDGDGAGGAGAAAGSGGLLAALPRFGALESLSVQRLPALDDGALAALAAPPRLRHLSASAAACALTADGAAGRLGDAAAAAAAVAGAGAPPRLRAVELHLPAAHLPRGVQALIAGGPPAPAAAPAPAPWWAAPAGAGGAPGGALAEALARALPGAGVCVRLTQSPLHRPAVVADC
ncbi:hypothetical protein Rsub_03897 [Raphidocelis subcapitata]|uniref:Uncharacterized protein n=1 Tax=Raphidocelis subcapitata TaxID=307507 RepID=A0A2V0NTS5_9CHLO|nr:hypothetical protein Rsub_03897 [Raphidocelis subcapitata]|eukprot:GBF91041.1 hypothetical protein Rsub_03897 [Raphidocelis subcapitata]